MNFWLKLLGTVGIIYFCTSKITCPPVEPERPLPEKVVEANHSVNDTIENDPVLSLEYHKYLKEIVNILETDNNFKKSIENASVEDIKSGKIASNLAFVDHNIRSKLDELKRKEIERLRTLISRKVEMNDIKHHEIEGILPKHLDHNNIETFEVGDLEKLIKQASVDLEQVDKFRSEEFKEHELQKEYERRKNLEQLEPEARQKAEKEHQEEIEKHKKHEKVNHPGSKQQLEEVWQEEDHLEPESFDPRTFFQLHDIDGNKYLDEFEIEALFQKELDKIFNSSDPSFDPVEREEEANRMRQHVFTEIDKDNDRMISSEEFLDATKQKEFENNQEWKGVDDEPQFNQQEFENYSKTHEQFEHTPPTHHASPQHP